MTSLTLTNLRCFFCGSSPEDRSEIPTWDWFHGRLDRRIAVCPRCTMDRGSQVTRLRAVAYSPGPRVSPHRFPDILDS